MTREQAINRTEFLSTMAPLRAVTLHRDRVVAIKGAPRYYGRHIARETRLVELMRAKAVGLSSR